MYASDQSLKLQAAVHQVLMHKMLSSNVTLYKGQVVDEAESGDLSAAGIRGNITEGVFFALLNAQSFVMHFTVLYGTKSKPTDNEFLNQWVAHSIKRAGLTPVRINEIKHDFCCDTLSNPQVTYRTYSPDNDMTSTKFTLTLAKNEFEWYKNAHFALLLKNGTDDQKNKIAGRMKVLS
jgi:hypothetical protein